MPIRYFCSDGARVSQSLIDKLYRQARIAKYTDHPMNFCEGCGQMANCYAHIIAQARCKILHKTELIWNPRNFFPSCHKCNQAIENPKGEAWKKLNNIIECIAFIEEHDQELFMKFSLNKD